jgi:sialidase-1
MHCGAAFSASFTLTALALQGTASAQQWIDPRCERLPFNNVLQIVELSDGRLLTTEGTGVKTSSDDGKTWSEPRRMYDGPGPGVPTDEMCCLLLKARSGAILAVYMDKASDKWVWDEARNEASTDSRLDIWSIRSLDDGKTWIDRQKVFDGCCGALIGMMQTSTGQIVVPMEPLLERNRWGTYTCVSGDDGKTWQHGNTIDLGGRGHHDGAMEGTVAELSNGRLLMLLRTNLDRFWEAYSDDGGRYWRELRPSLLDASSSPGWLIRLASGRLALLWNRLYLEGQNTIVPGGGPAYSERPASWQRAELSLAFSADDAKTWTQPVVIVREPGAWLSYPYAIERRPGEIWVITRFTTKVALRLREADFVPAK